MVLQGLEERTPPGRPLAVFRLVAVAVGLFVVIVAAGLYGPGFIAATRARLFSAVAAAPIPGLNRTFESCAAAHAKGVYSIRRGSPGYRPELDPDGDGVACERYLTR